VVESFESQHRPNPLFDSAVGHCQLGQQTERLGP
jgi:hypothetical protein